MSRTAGTITHIQPRTHDNDSMTRQNHTYGNAPPDNNASAQPPSASNGQMPRSRLPHIEDLRRKAADSIQDCGPSTPMSKLLDRAETSARGVKANLTFKRPDLAYVEYIAGSELLLNVIPKHKEYSAISVDRNGWQARYKNLRIFSDSYNPEMTHIVEIIKKDNIATGVEPFSGYNAAKAGASAIRADESNGPPSPRPYSMPLAPSSNTLSSELFLDGTSKRSPSPHHVPSRSASIRNQSPPPRRKEKPTIQPKPAGLRLRPLNPSDVSEENSALDDDLANRFLRMRVQRNAHGSVTTNDSQRRPSEFAHPERKSSSFQPSVRSDQQYESGLSSPTSPSKPLGPRPMPTSSQNPAIPPKLPLSPATFRTSDPQSGTPRSSYDSASAELRPEIPSRPSSRSRPDSLTLGERSPRSVKRLSANSALANGVIPPSRSSSMQPPQTSISAEELYEKKESGHIFFIDVRHRSDFDAGHIHVPNIICVEPVGLRPTMSMEELEESLVYSPSGETELFERINQFEYVVYYDQSTAADDFLNGPPQRTAANHLRAVHDSLFEFNDYLPLRRRPMVLRGGLDAWIDLMGMQALVTSETAVFVGPGARTRRARPSRKSLGRLPSANENSSLEIRKRRLREQKPLDAEEERSWLEKAQREVSTPLNPQSQSDGEEDGISQQYVHSYDEFLRRYPEAGKLQQSMISAPSQVRVPAPTAPPPPPPALAPAIPSRPPPAVARPSYGGVSDQKQSQSAPLQRQNSAAQQPLYTSRSTSRYLKLPRTGLINFGVTCYMNATIQCLLATIPISIFFLGENWRRMTQRNWKGSNGVLPEFFASLIRNLWSDEKTPIRPTSLRSFCARLKDEWGLDRQQDAKEFFDFLVDCLHEDLNINFDRPPPRTLTDQEELVRESWPISKAAASEWNRYTQRESSFISNQFAGQHASRLRCTTCNSTSTTYEAFYSISVEIPPRSPKRGNWHLYSCLRSYCQEERLSGDEVWRCPHCKAEREATKQITITRAPQFLVLHFKRFEMRRGDAKKVHTVVDFPLHGLDMSEFMAAPDKFSSEGPLDQATSPPFIYDCYAVMRHIGNTGNGGHYISLIRDSVRGCWRKFDDDRVTDFEPSKWKGDKALQNEQAYLLFYERSSPR